MSTVTEVHLLHHCHTDVGYTHDQPVLWDLQRRFIDGAIDLAERDLDVDGPAAFRWTVETAAPLLEWLRTASEDQLARFERLEDAGRIEVTGMLVNATPLSGPAQTVDSLRPVATLRDEYGFDVDYAMNGDVNGHNWPLADALLDADIHGFSMAINAHFGGAPLSRPMAFEWEAPSGRTLPAYNGFHYSTGWQLGIGHDAEVLAEEWWPRIERRLDEAGYDLPALMVQSYHPFADNAPAYDGFGPFVEAWNEREDVRDGPLPRLRISTPSEWWAVVEDHRDDLPTHRGDWTDFWNFGSISSARETATNRESRSRLLTADACESVLRAMGRGAPDRGPTRRAQAGTRGDAWWALHMYDEHTWGADASVGVPDGEDAASQWYHKAGYAYDAASLSKLLRRDAVAELARHAPRAEVADE